MLAFVLSIAITLGVTNDHPPLRDSEEVVVQKVLEKWGEAFIELFGEVQTRFPTLVSSLYLGILHSDDADALSIVRDDSSLIGISVGLLVAVPIEDQESLRLIFFHELGHQYFRHRGTRPIVVTEAELSRYPAVIRQKARRSIRNLRSGSEVGIWFILDDDVLELLQQIEADDFAIDVSGKYASACTLKRTFEQYFQNLDCPPRHAGSLELCHVRLDNLARRCKNPTWKRFVFDKDGHIASVGVPKSSEKP